MVKSKILSKYPKLWHFFGDKNYTSRLRNIVFAEQIHENRVMIIKNDNEKLIKGYDGMITDKPLLLGIRTADCLPIFFYDPKRKIVAAIHAGWKGLYGGIIDNAIDAIVKLGCNPVNLKVAIGPHIQVCCYNVSDERIQKFQITNASDRLHLLSENFFGELRMKSWYFNLSKVALFQLRSLGFKSSNIDISDICTSCNKNFWSFRRDGQSCGRMLNVIGMIEQNHAIA